MNGLKDNFDEGNPFSLRKATDRRYRFNPYKPSFPFWGPRQTVKQQNAASDQRLHCLLTEMSIKKNKNENVHQKPLK